MVNQKLILLVLIISLILVGCGLENISKEKSVVSTVAMSVPSSTLLPIKTVTPKPTETKPSISTATFIIPSPTLSLTPLPTLSFYKTAYLLYEAKNECDIPCWRGITPGISKWSETKQFIESLDSFYSSGIEKSPDWSAPITKSSQREMYQWFVRIPDSHAYAAVLLEVQNNIITAIAPPQDLFTKFFPIHKFFEVYSKPDKVLVYIPDYYKNNSMYDAYIYLVYEKKHILAEYAFWGSETINAVNLCLQHLSPQGMYLWGSGLELNQDFSAYKPLDEVSGFSLDTFYERFINKNHQCFEISKDAWK